MFHKKKYLRDLPIKETNYKIEVSEKIKVDDVFYNIKLVYENEPINLRRLEIRNNDEKIQMGFFDHSFEQNLNKKFFSMINPYLN